MLVCSGRAQAGDVRGDHGGCRARGRSERRLAIAGRRLLHDGRAGLESLELDAAEHPRRLRAGHHAHRGPALPQGERPGQVTTDRAQPLLHHQ